MAMSRLDCGYMSRSNCGYMSRSGLGYMSRLDCGYMSRSDCGYMSRLDCGYMSRYILFEASRHLRQWFVDLQVTFHVAEPLHPMSSDAPACGSAHARGVDLQHSGMAAVPTLCSVPWGGGTRF